MVRLNKTVLVEKIAKSSFKECDLDGTGHIDAKELHVGLLLVYDKLNKALPVYLKPPKHDTVRALMKKYDADGNGTLDFHEFHQCVRTMVGLNEDAKFTDSIPFVIGRRMLFKMALFPLVAFGIKKLLVAAGGDGMDVIPNGVLSFGVEGVAKLAAVKLRT
ncbi:Calcium-binding EF hand family [Micractinium conductrix]|uniref:Calcium-binding EF hand family n=1 Tax=Micractinium conductrix TaxID=554055 RepID=A0A2P6VCI9_9CHLO|nr:Calcium-binding EF hand family [Micractinium conductrix]|eukprot:PSC71794.1 Calcium-binding EF hand family [Micractinium conductrix]